MMQVSVELREEKVFGATSNLKAEYPSDPMLHRVCLRRRLQRYAFPALVVTSAVLNAVVAHLRLDSYSRQVWLFYVAMFPISGAWLKQFAKLDMG